MHSNTSPTDHSELDRQGVQRSALWWLLVWGYGLTNVWSHETVNALVVRLVQIQGLPAFLWTMRAAALTGLTILLVWKRSRLKGLLLLAPFALALDYSLIIYPSERIHYVQYGLLTWAAYRAVQDRLAAVLIAFLFGFVDEAHQFWILYATDPIVYFDWNDVVLNLMGAIGALLLILPDDVRPRRFQLRQTLAAIGAWMIVAGLLVQLFAPDRYLLGNQSDEVFWLTSGVGTTYHVLNALEGSVLVGAMLIVLCGRYWPSSPSFRT